jgi:molybdopterin-guanine dinucleotide biosynthesis protein A
MHCVVLAGGLDTPNDPMYVLTQGKPKALLDMSGRTMLERVVDALQASQIVEDVVVIGLGSDMGMSFARPVTHLPDQGSLPGNLIVGADWLHEHYPDEIVFLLCTADIPTITPEIVDAFVESCRPFDRATYYNMVTREVMEARFPHSKRTFVKLKDQEIAGGDMNVVRFDIVHENYELLQALTNARKHAWQLASIVGFRMIIKLLLRQLTPTDIEDETERILGRRAKIFLSPYAELGMDADKPGQVELLRKEFM